MSAAPRKADADLPLKLAGWALLAVAFALRLGQLNLPLERDEGEYAYAAQLLLQGVPPYSGVYTMKFPGTSAAYALLMACFGRTPLGIHLGVAVVVAASVWLVYVLARRWHGSTVGVVAAGLFSLLTVPPSLLGLAGHATHFVTLCALGGAALLDSALERGSRGRLLASGACFGAAVLMKQHALFLALGAGAILAVEGRLSAERARVVLLRLGLFGLGFAAPLGATFLALWAAGVFESFWLWTVKYGLAYASPAPSGVLPALGAGVAKAAGGLWPVWVAALWGAAAAARRLGERGSRLSLAFLVFSFLSVVPGLYFRSHYFLVMLPWLAILAGRAVAGREEERRSQALSSVWVPVLLLAAVASYGVWEGRAVFFQRNPRLASRAIYRSNPFAECADVAAYLRARTAPADRILVLGSEPEIYFHAERRGSTGHVYMYPLMEEQPYARAMQEQLIRDVERALPEYVVFVDSAFSWLAGPGSEPRLLAWARDLLGRRYRRVAAAQVVARDKTVYYWGEEAARELPKAAASVVVFQRK